MLTFLHTWPTGSIAQPFSARYDNSSPLRATDTFQRGEHTGGSIACIFARFSYCDVGSRNESDAECCTEYSVH